MKIGNSRAGEIGGSGGGDDFAEEGGEGVQVIALDVIAVAVEGLGDAVDDRFVVAKVVGVAPFVVDVGDLDGAQVEAGGGEAGGGPADVGGH